MSLKLLIVEDEPELEVTNVPLSCEDKASEAEEADMELPGEFTIQDDFDLLTDAATALESIGTRIAIEGIDLSTARELDKLAPGFLRQAGGHSVFTNRPSLEGLSEATTSVSTTLAELMQRARVFVAGMYKRFREWLVNLVNKPEATGIQQEVEEFLAKQSSRAVMQYISSLPDTPQEAADEIARFMDGDTKQFSMALAEQLQSTVEMMQKLEEQIEAHPVQFRLAKGIVTVAEYFKEEANSSVQVMLKKASAAADIAMKCRNAQEFAKALEVITSVEGELREFSANMVVHSKPSKDLGDENAVAFDKLYDNVTTAVKDFQRLDIQDQVKSLTTTIEDIIRISEETKIEDVLEMIPDDVANDQRNAYAKKIVALYRDIASTGVSALNMWKLRLGSVQGINVIGSKLIEIVESFESDVAACVSSLQPEQKEQLAKALRGKGLSTAGFGTSE